MCLTEACASGIASMPDPEPCGDDASVEDLKAENKRLRKELRNAEIEREILKKATAYFAKESQ